MSSFGTPIDLRKLISLNKLNVGAEYELQEVSKPDIEEILRKCFEERN